MNRIMAVSSPQRRLESVDPKEFNKNLRALMANWKRVQKVRGASQRTLELVRSGEAGPREALERATTTWQVHRRGNSARRTTLATLEKGGWFDRDWLTADGKLDEDAELALTSALSQALGARWFVVLEGGTRSGKTYSTLEFIANYAAQTPGVDVICARKDRQRWKKAARRDWINILSDMGIWGEVSENKQTLEYAFPNGSMVYFIGTADVEDLKGPGCDLLFINECTEVSYDAWCELQQRCRGLVICDLNPSLPVHWVFDTVLSRGAREVLHVVTTFRDNPHLPAEQKLKILGYEPTPENKQRGTADAWRWQVYGLGKRARRPGAVFENFEECDFFPERHQCQRHWYGLDFGYTVDPTALVECALHNDILYVRSLIYETGLQTAETLTNQGAPTIESRMRELGIPYDAKIYADSAEPKTIDTLRACGWVNLRGAEKPKNCILHRIDLMKQRAIRIPFSDQNLLFEFTHYSFRYDQRTGVFLNEPEDDNNHGIDAIGYGAQYELEVRQVRRVTGQGGRVYRARTAATGKRW